MPEKLRVQEAHDAAVAQMNDDGFKLHQSDCGICEDFGRPIPVKPFDWQENRTSSKQEERNG